MTWFGKCERIRASLLGCYLRKMQQYAPNLLERDRSLRTQKLLLLLLLLLLLCGQASKIKKRTSAMTFSSAPWYTEGPRLRIGLVLGVGSSSDVEFELLQEDSIAAAWCGISQQTPGGWVGSGRVGLGGWAAAAFGCGGDSDVLFF